jgi:8-oxo-dGTP diphosphatase
MSLPVTHVAVGILQRSDGACLYAQRPPGKPYAGWWEFPGGKQEPNEPIEKSLERELLEELGVQIHTYSHWVVRDHLYAHARVCLHFFKITSWSGEPRSLEGQAFEWRLPRQSALMPLLPAAWPLLDWLQFDHQCLMSNAQALGIPQMIKHWSDLFELGIAASQSTRFAILHEPELEGAAFDALFLGCMRLCATHGVKLLISYVHDLSYALAADGLHIAQEGIDQALKANIMQTVMPAWRFVSFECQTSEQLSQAANMGASFAICNDESLQTYLPKLKPFVA